MAEREDIARRHGIPHLAHKLVGGTPGELEADAAARAAIIRMFTPRRLDEQPPVSPAPPIEGLPPKDKPISDYTDEERAASHASFDRTMRERAVQEERARQEQEERQRADANRTPGQRHGDAIRAALAPGAKNAADEALVRSMHPSRDES